MSLNISRNEMKYQHIAYVSEGFQINSYLEEYKK